MTCPAAFGNSYWHGATRVEGATAFPHLTVTSPKEHDSHRTSSARRVPRVRPRPSASPCADATAPLGVQAVSRAPQRVRPFPSTETVQRDRRGGDVPLPDPNPVPGLPRIPRPAHDDPLRTCHPPEIGPQERPGKLALDESHDGPAVVFLSLQVDPQPSRALPEVVRGVPLDTLVSVMEAHYATGCVAEFPAAAFENLPEAALEGIGSAAGGMGHGGG